MAGHPFCTLLINESDVQTFFPGPYLCYYDLPTPSLVQQAHDFIFDVIEQDGPFDGVIAFSQGAALVASMMLQHAKTGSTETLFKVAVFAGATLPYNLDDEHCLSKHETEVLQMPDEDSEDERGYPTNPKTSTEPLLSRYHPEQETARILIPTLHIIGEQDKFAPQSRLVARLCGGEKRVVEHKEGHRMPSDGRHQWKVLTAIASTIQAAYFNF